MLYFMAYGFKCQKSDRAYVNKCGHWCQQLAATVLRISMKQSVAVQCLFQCPLLCIIRIKNTNNKSV